ncbi:hypothetical protein DFH09DRAFT_1133295 [Mycena vulgaris]|nr:hypothetical protein DFH09DRAFT_1133295 [Mycena vulgaris]
MERGPPDETSARPVPVDELDISKEVSSDSLNNLAPQYHYHGLATTQTQSEQEDDSNLNDEGSQKENASFSREALFSSSKQVQGVQSPAKASLVEKPRCPPAKSITNAKGVSFDSPKAVATPIKLPEGRSTGRPLRRVTPTPKRELSQDSFAGDFGDPAEKFIASSKQFDIPVAQLTSPSVEGSPHPARRSVYPDNIPPMESPKAVRRAVDTNDEEGTILVNSTPTPSNSGSSQSQQSQPHSQSQSQGPFGEEQSDDYNMNERQPEEDDRILPPQPSDSQDSVQYESSEPSSSYRRMYENPTQQTQIEPTQLINEPTQPYSASLTNFNTEEEHRGDTFSNITSTTGQARTLLDSLDEHKRSRYAARLGISRIDREPVDPSVTDYSSSAARGGHLALQDTQPAYDQGHALSNWSAGNSKPSTSAVPRVRQAVVDERTEVIPDSEPLREGSLSPVSPAKPSTRSPTKSRPRPPSSDTETDAEVIPDSMDVDGEDRDEVLGILNAKSSVRQEEEEEEEEEEVPLAATNLAGKGGKRADLKGKGKAIEMGPPPIKPKDNRSRSNAKSPATKPNRKGKDSLNSQKRRTRKISPEVPSSVPHQDLPAANPVSTAKPKVATRAKSAAATRVRKKVGGSTKRRNETEDEEESSEDELLMPRSERDEEVRTESPDDEYMAAGPSTRKRKRGIKAESPSVQYQARPRRVAKSASTRPAKRARATSASTQATVEPTRVFALWRKDGHYYSGVVHSQIAQGRYRVDFDDETSDDVKLDQMRVCNPRIGDIAFVAGLHRPVEITAVSLADEMVEVKADNYKNGFHVSALRIGSRTIASGWTDRVLTAEAIVCVKNPPRSLTSPTPSRISVLSAASSRRSSDLFSKMGFCITHALEAEEEKEAISTLIRNNGGVVIDDWEDLITMKGKQTSTRWMLKQKDVNLVLRGLERVFLLSDDASQTPKFLLALALGIPCLRIEFITRAVDAADFTDWMMYLLPSGFSESRNCRVTQFVNADWGEDADDIKDIMNNPVAFKVFKGKKILCIGAEVLTVTKGRKNGNLAVPRIMLAMGAEFVEAVREEKHASCALSDYDYIVNKDDNVRISKLRECTVVPWDWVKDALISGSIPIIK